MPHRTEPRRAALDRLPLGAIMATAFAAALAFALYAMPNWLLARAVMATRLPDLLAVAEPPLGAVARALVMLVVGAGGGLAVWALFRWVERPRAPHRFATFRRVAERCVVPEGPTLRRADAHPDAPSRRPIFAAADLGVPLDEAPLAAWSDQARAAEAEPAPELLLDTEVMADQAEAAPTPPDTAAGLLARLEASLARRGAPPAPDARLRQAFARAVNG